MVLVNLVESQTLRRIVGLTDSIWRYQRLKVLWKSKMTRMCSGFWKRRYWEVSLTKLLWTSLIHFNIHKIWIKTITKTCKNSFNLLALSPSIDILRTCSCGNVYLLEFLSEKIVSTIVMRLFDLFTECFV